MLLFSAVTGRALEEQRALPRLQPTVHPTRASEHSFHRQEAEHLGETADARAGAGKVKQEPGTSRFARKQGRARGRLGACRGDTGSSKGPPGARVTDAVIIEM